MGGRMQCSCVVLVSEALPLLGGWGGRMFMYCTIVRGAPIAWVGGWGAECNVHMLY